MRKNFLRITFTFIFIHGICYSQQINYAQLIKKYTEADKYYKKAIQLGLQTNSNENAELKYNQAALKKFSELDRLLSQAQFSDSIRFFTLLKIADLQFYFDSLNVALVNYNKAIKIGKSISFLPDSFLFKPYLFSGNIYFQYNQLDSAKESFKFAEGIQNRYSKKLEESERLYNALGVLYYQSGNYRQCINYFRKAAEVIPLNHPYYKDLFVNYRINFATALFKLEIYDSAKKILNDLLHYNQHLNEIYNNIGLIYFNLSKPYNAIQAFQKVHYTDKLQIGLYNDLANAWLSLNKIDSATFYLNKAFHANNQLNSFNSSIDHGLSFKIQAELQLKLKEPLKALANYQLAIREFYPAFRDTSIFKNPSKYSGVFSYINLFKTLTSKAEAFHSLYVYSGNITWAIAELNTYESTFSLFDYIETIYDSDEARLFLEKSKYLIHQKPIDIAFELYRKTSNNQYLEKAYVLDEKTKASVLVFNEQRNNLIKSTSGIVDREQELKEQITRLSLKAGSITDPLQIQALNNEIGDKEIMLGKILEQRSQDHPLVYSKVPSTHNLQNELLDEHTIIISYHLTENKLTRFIIGHNNFNGIQKNKYEQFDTDLGLVINYFNTDNSINDPGNIDGLIERIYQFLLGDLNIRSGDQIIIIPDDELNYFPFEALKFNGHYLIEDHPVQYQYSTVLLKKETSSFRNLSTLSFAPFTANSYHFDDLDFQRLPYSYQEIKHNKGPSYTALLATKKNFINLIPNYDIIHLATHASASSQNNRLPFITFAPWQDTIREDFLLYAPEIYNLQLKKNRLIILSACETASGNLVKGEGVMSLSRAFAYAGCQNIITSLWKADDEATSQITQKVHFYLNQGKSIAEALQMAKKDYLLNPTINPRKKNPAYWAHLIYIGNYQPSYSNYNWFWIIGLILISSVFFIIIRKIIVSNAKS